MSRQAYILERVEPEPNSGCWLWTLSVGSHGYGNASDPALRKVRTAHRLSYEAFVAPIPRGMFVCHKCNNRACVNPDHLRVGTHIQNMDDVSRGRYHGRRKLSTQQVRSIRASRAPQRSLASQYGVSQGTIHHVKAGHIYRHD